MYGGRGKFGDDLLQRFEPRYALYSEIAMELHEHTAPTQRPKCHLKAVVILSVRPPTDKCLSVVISTKNAYGGSFLKPVSCILSVLGVMSLNSYLGCVWLQSRPGHRLA
jgi:hypothetical protein